MDGIPGHAQGGFAAAASSGAVHSVFSPPGSNNLEGMLGTGSYLVLPGETRRHDRAGHGAALRPRCPSRGVEHGIGVGPGPDSLPGDHGGVRRREGGVHRGQHARRGPGDLQPPRPGHAPADGLDRPVRAGPGRRHGDVAGPEDPVALQHVPEQWPAAHAHLHAVDHRIVRHPASRRRAPGCISCWSRRTGRWRSPTPTRSSWPTRSSPSRVGSREARVPCDDGRRPPGRRPRHDDRRRHREPGRPLPVTALAHHRVRRTRARPPVALLRLRGAPRRSGGRARCDAPGRHPRAVGHHAAQGRCRGRRRRVQRGRPPAGRRELRPQPGRLARSGPTPTGRASSPRCAVASTSTRTAAAASSWAPVARPGPSCWPWPRPGPPRSRW